MPRLTAALTVIALGGAVGCGEEEKTVSDRQIVEALELKRDDDRPVYAIGGDEFCEVDENLFNDAAEVEDAASQKASSGLVITNRQRTIGVQAIPPFDPLCQRDARRALDRIQVE